MNRVVLRWLGEVTASRDFLEPVIEFGARQVPGQVGLTDLRSFFPGREYIGCDLDRGPGVDRVENLEFSHFAPDSVGTVVCLETLEHVRRPWDAAREIFRILKPGGTTLISIPFNFAIHCFPDDYWRMTASGLAALLEAAGFRDVETSDSGEDVEWDLFWDQPEKRPEGKGIELTDRRHFPYSCFAIATKPARQALPGAQAAVPALSAPETPPEGRLEGTVPIIMVLYHREEDTRKTLEQLQKVTKNYELVLVDNGFDDTGYIESLGAARYINNDTNTGITRAVNQGLEVAKGKYVAVMHNDLLLYEEGWLDHILDFLERRPDVGIVGLVGRHSIGEDGSLDEETLLAGLPDFEYSFKPTWRFTEVATIDGIGWVMRNLGMRLDESIGPVHYYDLDISMQYIEAGYRVYCANVEFYHLREEYLKRGGSEAALTSGTDKEEEYLEGRERFATKWGHLLPITRGFADERYTLNRVDDLLNRFETLEDEYTRLAEYAKKLDADSRDKEAEIGRAKEYVAHVEAAHQEELAEKERYTVVSRELEGHIRRLERELSGARAAASEQSPGASVLERAGFYLRTEGASSTARRALTKLFGRGD